MPRSLLGTLLVAAGLGIAYPAPSSAQFREGHPPGDLADFSWTAWLLGEWEGYAEIGDRRVPWRQSFRLSIDHQYLISEAVHGDGPDRYMGTGVFSYYPASADAYGRWFGSRHDTNDGRGVIEDDRVIWTIWRANQRITRTRVRTGPDSYEVTNEVVLPDGSVARTREVMRRVGSFDTHQPAVLERSLDGFALAESAKPDPKRGVVYVSNIVGHPQELDDNGRISRVHPDGRVEPGFIDGADPAVTLHAPKGIHVDGDTLWVVDADALRGFVLPMGTPARQVSLDHLPGAFPNSTTRLPDGTFFVTDTGFRISPDLTVERTGTDRIIRIDPSGEISVPFSGPTLGAPNGIAYDAEEDLVLFVTSADQRVLGFRPSSDTISFALDVAPGLDGLVVLDRETLLVSSLPRSAVLRVDRRTGRSEPVVTGRRAGDIGFDAVNGHLLLPLLGQNRVEFWTCPAGPPNPPDPEPTRHHR